MQRFSLVLLLSLFVAVSVNAADPNLTVCGSVINGFVNDPTSCAAYYSCVNGQGFSQKCSYEFHFNPLISACDYPNEDGTCAGVTECPPNVEFLRVPDPNSCTKYTLCFLGVGTNSECAEGLQFNTVTGQCDLTQIVNCIDVSKCPERDTPGVTVFIPHPSDCQKYYYCIGGGASTVPITCPVGYVFDEPSQTCKIGLCPPPVFIPAVE